jgi:hypothetical protein
MRMMATEGLGDRDGQTQICLANPLQIRLVPFPKRATPLLQMHPNLTSLGFSIDKATFDIYYGKYLDPCRVVHGK